VFRRPNLVISAGPMSTATPGTSSFSTLARRARDRFLLTDALKQAVARPPERQALLREYWTAALDRTDVADQLTDERGAVAALLLYREALPLLVAAIALANDPDFPTGGSPLPAGHTPWQVLDDLRQRGRLSTLPRKLDQARSALAAVEPLAFDRLAPQVLLDRRAAVAATMRRLRRLVEPRAPSEIKGNRHGRLAAAAIVLALLATAVVSHFRHPNLALNKPVSASSRHPGSTAPPDNSGVTNGVIEPTYGIETAPGPGWVLVDLQDDQKITRVKVFNRRDALFDAGLPLFLETSPDAVNFKVVDTRRQPFSSTNPWIYQAGPGTRARFIRVRSNSLVALTEIEVY